MAVYGHSWSHLHLRDSTDDNQRLPLRLRMHARTIPHLPNNGKRARGPPSSRCGRERHEPTVLVRKWRAEEGHDMMFVSDTWCFLERRRVESIDRDTDLHIGSTYHNPESAAWSLKLNPSSEAAAWLKSHDSCVVCSTRIACIFWYSINPSAVKYSNNKQI